MVKRRHIILTLLFLLYFGIRVFFALKSNYFNDDYSYFALRQIDNIAKTGMPLIHDELSYGGRSFVFLPLYFYLLAFFTLFFPKIIIIKIINNLFASTLVIAIYLVTSRIFKNRKVALVCSFVAASLPIYLSETLNTISTSSIIFPGGFFLLFLFMEMENNKDFLNYLILLTILLVLISPSVLLILLGLVIFAIACYLENVTLARIKLEFLSFFMFFFLWCNFIIYKSAFQEHGFSIIWNNTPTSIMSMYFTNINIFNALASIGILPLVFGIYTIYKYLLTKKNKKILLFISLFLSTFIVFWSKLVPSELALMFLGTALVILFGQFLADLFATLKDTKFSKQENWIFGLVIFLLILTQISPSIILMIRNSQANPTKEYISGFEWLKENSPEDTTVLAIPEEGNLITYFGQRKNVIDSEYLLVDDAENRYYDVKKVYTVPFRIEALSILEKYNANYILFSKKTKEKFSIDRIEYIDSDCFSFVFGNKEIAIYKINREKCELKNL